MPAWRTWEQFIPRFSAKMVIHAGSETFLRTAPVLVVARYANDGAGDIFRNIKFMLGSGSWDFVSFILCHNEPFAGGIGNHFNGIIDTAVSCNASGKLRYSAVVFGSVLIRHECCGIDIFYGSASLPPAKEAGFIHLLPDAAVDNKCK